MAASGDTFHHIRDYPYFELLQGKHVQLPKVEWLPSPSRFIDYLQGEIPQSEVWGLQLTKFMVLQSVAVILAFLVFTGLALKMRMGQPVKGRWWNFWEFLALFIRDEVVRPGVGVGHAEHHDMDDPAHHDLHTTGAIEHASHDGNHNEKHAVQGGHPADRYLPFVWTLFFYILFCNLLGAIPFLGTPTGHLSVTGALAGVTMLYVIASGSRELGLWGYWKSLVPSMDVPGFMAIIIVPLIWFIEFAGLIIKHAVLAVRLFANMMAGHTVLFVILTFIQVSAGTIFWYGVMPASVGGQVVIGLLEVFVAFLQAYVFSLLTSLFIGAAVHPH